MKKSSDTLYFDGNCSQCAGEMRLLKRLKDESLQLIDIHQLASAAPACKINKNDLLSILHLQTAEGAWLKGLDANVRAWRHTSIGWLLIPLRWPGIGQLADKIYYKWAQKRACRLGYK